MNPDAQTIRRMFDRLAPRYDLFNRLTSFGMDSRWRRHALEPLCPGMRVLDLGCGTGDLAIEAARRLGGRGEVVALDFSAGMLELARRRYARTGMNGNGRVRFELRRAEEVPFEEARYDLVLSGFVLRNLYENIDAILAGVFRSLKPGGQISFLDMTEPASRLKAGVWKLYMNTLVALYGKALFGSDYPTTYITDSAGRFVKAEGFLAKLRAAGFADARARSMMLDVVTLYRATRP
jgi:demethylmenaquinone methyltransferase/2-methoxy-6-polyprenyl-1,4-benzoquinol methylase